MIHVKTNELCECTGIMCLFVCEYAHVRTVSIVGG